MNEVQRFTIFNYMEVLQLKINGIIKHFRSFNDV